VAKCEFYLPGGSLKDRIAKRMIEDAEKQGKIAPGKTTIIEATSGNTGIGLSLVGAVKGYDVIITLPEKMSQEKSDVLAALGAKIIRTPTEANFDDLDSHIGVARKMNKNIKDSIILDQYTNPGNALVHYDETAEEIWEQCDGKLDYVIIAAGTGGTITGIARKMKEKDKNIQIIGVDPYGSILAYPDELNSRGIFSYKVEGTGYDFIPKNCYRSDGIIDKWYKSDDFESFKYARRLIKEEGLLVGGSSGSVIWAALQVCKDLPADKRVVCVFVDSVRNYLTKFVNDDWLLENEFLTQEQYDDRYFTQSTNIYGQTGQDFRIKELGLKTVTTLTTNSIAGEVLKEFESQNIECVIFIFINIISYLF
jgi:cystathionine beta-synthase